MAKVRVSTLAKEFGMTSKELMGHLAEMKIPAKSASSTLEDAYVAMVRKQLASVIEARAQEVEAAKQAEEQAAAAEEAARAAEAERERIAQIDQELAYLEADNALTLEQMQLDIDLCKYQMEDDNRDYKAGGEREALKENELRALEAALQYDREAILEEAVPGFEVGCAVVGRGADLLLGEVDEVELASGFFDYEEKYTLKTSALHVPARLSPADAARVKAAAAAIYRALGCAGFARVDLFFTPEGRIVFNEVNTIPGFTEHSRFPAMLRAAGCGFSQILTKILEEAMRA